MTDDEKSDRFISSIGLMRRDGAYIALEKLRIRISNFYAQRIGDNTIDGYTILQVLVIIEQMEEEIREESNEQNEDRLV